MKTAKLTILIEKTFCLRIWVIDNQWNEPNSLSQITLRVVRTEEFVFYIATKTRLFQMKQKFEYFEWSFRESFNPKIFFSMVNIKTAKTIINCLCERQTLNLEFYVTQLGYYKNNIKSQKQNKAQN